MAETAITVRTLDLGLSGDTYSGFDPQSSLVAVDETNGNKIANASGRVMLYAKNAGAGAHVVTITSQINCDQGHSHDPAVSIPASGERIIGPFQPREFNDSTDNVILAWDAGSNGEVTVDAWELAEDGR